jgi:hypothetical protein
MIHIATVHWLDDRWIDIQLRYLNTHLRQPFKVYAFLNGLQRDHRPKFHYSSTEPIPSHAIKLNLLADIATFNAKTGDDLLMFLDGDAFPVGDILSHWQAKSSEYPLMAIQRKENATDIQPHPSFCLTTIGFWNEIRGDWKDGYSWKDPQGRDVSDVGGNLLGILKERKIAWYPLLRSNQRDLHPLWFGLYDDLIYHHGAGFRNPTSRADLARLGAWGVFYFETYAKLPAAVRRMVPRGLRPLRRTAKRNRAASERVFGSILADPCFYRYFQHRE